MRSEEERGGVMKRLQNELFHHENDLFFYIFRHQLQCHISLVWQRRGEFIAEKDKEDNKHILQLGCL